MVEMDLAVRKTQGDDGCVAQDLGTFVAVAETKRATDGLASSVTDCVKNLWALPTAMP